MRQQVKHAQKLGDEEIENLKKFLGIVLNKMRYPSDFDFDSKDDFEHDFLVYRNVCKDLPTLYFKNVRLVLRLFLSSI